MTFPVVPIIKQYMDYVDKYTEKLGKRTVVFIQVGDFMELYYYDSVNNTKNKEIAEYLCDKLNFKVAKKAKQDFLMAGFPIHAADKYFSKIVSMNFSLVEITQTKMDANGMVTRGVSNIYSPGTDIIYNNNPNQNWTMNLYFAGYKSIITKNQTIQVGVSMIDTRTGQSYFAQYQSNPQSTYSMGPLDECIRLIQQYTPSEICIQSPNSMELELDKEYILSYLGIKETNRLIIHWEHKLHDNDFRKKQYRTYFLKKTFNRDIDWIEEQLGLQYMEEASISLCYLLDFISFHNSILLDKIDYPSKIEEEDKLCLTNNSIQQLNIIPKEDGADYTFFGEGKQINSLLSILNKANTPMGKRGLRGRLLNPITDIKCLEEHYDTIDYLRGDDIIKEIKVYLQMMKTDLSQIHRRWMIDKLRNNDFVSAVVTYDKFLEMITQLSHIDWKDLPESDIITEFKTCLVDIHHHFDINKIPTLMNNTLIDETFIKKGIHVKLDNMVIELVNCNKSIITINKDWTKIWFQNNKNGGCLKNGTQMDSIFKTLENENYFITTEARAKKFMIKVQDYYGKNSSSPIKTQVPQKKTRNNNQIMRIFEFDIKDFRMENNGGKTKEKRIVHPVLEELLDRRNELLMEIHQINMNMLKSKLVEYKLVLPVLNKIELFIMNLDINISIAECANKYGYCRPLFDSDTDARGYSRFDIKGMRHPIIERIIDTEYIKTNICLDENCQGFPLFGTNASGKSSLQKAVGLNIIMAQSGFYVPCDSLILSPYKKLFTRIINDDNLFKGMSTFQKEMTELGSITNQICSRSIVLGDELCSGTEKNSAVAIFTSSIDYIVKKDAHFIFATHFHDIMNQREIIENPKITSYHLTVKYNPETDVMVYDRILMEGPGGQNYGIEVCKNCGNLPNELITLAIEIGGRERKKEMAQNPLSQSHFNANQLLGGTCDICENSASEEIHHIKFQCTANKDGLIDDYVSKNSRWNLVALCKTCHYDIHHKQKITIKGWDMTNKGRVLNFTRIDDNGNSGANANDNGNSGANDNDNGNSGANDNEDNSVKKRRKYDDNQVEEVIKLSKIHKNKQIKNLMMKKYDINMSIQTIKKMIDKIY